MTITNLASARRSHGGWLRSRERVLQQCTRGKRRLASETRRAQIGPLDQATVELDGPLPHLTDNSPRRTLPASAVQCRRSSCGSVPQGRQAARSSLAKCWPAFLIHFRLPKYHCPAVPGLETPLSTLRRDCRNLGSVFRACSANSSATLRPFLPQFRVEEFSE